MNQFSVRKATLWLKMSISSSVHQSVTKTPQSIRIMPISHYLQPWCLSAICLSAIIHVGHHSYQSHACQPSYLSINVSMPISHYAYQPSFQTAIIPICHRKIFVAYGLFCIVFNVWDRHSFRSLDYPGSWLSKC